MTTSQKLAEVLSFVCIAGLLANPVGLLILFWGGDFWLILRIVASGCVVAAISLILALVLDFNRG